MIQLSHLYMTTGKTTALTIWTFVGKVMSLLFNTLSRFIIVFLPKSLLFLSGGQSTRASASASVLSMNIQDWFPLRLTDLISLLSKGLLRVFSSTTVGKYQFFGAQTSWWSNSHIHTWLREKPQLWLDRPLLAKWCLCFLICWQKKWEQQSYGLQNENPITEN